MWLRRGWRRRPPRPRGRNAGRMDQAPVSQGAGKRGPTVGTRFLLDSALTTVGPPPGSASSLADVPASRRHAEFYRHGAGFLVRDVGSLNGTYVNRERIEETALNDGDEVQVGKFRLTFLGARRSQADRGGGAQGGARGLSPPGPTVGPGR